MANKKPVVKKKAVSKPEKKQATKTPVVAVDSGLINSLFEATKKQPVAFEELCDMFDMSPYRLRNTIEEAKKQGVRVHVEHGHVGLLHNKQSDDIKTVGPSPVVGKRFRIASISDTHLGSKYCLREQLKDFIHHAYSKGVRVILHTGDVLDGAYHRHGLYELSHVGIDEQARDLYETLPQLPGLEYHGITGNHDETFTLKSGVDAGHFLAAYFHKRGRHDLHFHGNRGAFLRVGGAVVHLWHPLKGPAYAKSYGVQKQIEKYSSIKPQILLCGHWHMFNYCVERGVHGIACPTFQGGGSAFGNALGGAPAIGGLMLSWALTEHGTIRNFALEPRLYYEKEKPIEIYNQLDAIPLERSKRSA